MASKDHQNTDLDAKTGDGSASQSKKKMTPEEQSARFIETARELECDESGNDFKDLMKKISSKEST